MTMRRPLNFLFATAHLGSNVSPVMPVVRWLVAAGHRVRVMSDGVNRLWRRSIILQINATRPRYIGWALRGPLISRRRCFDPTCAMPVRSSVTPFGPSRGVRRGTRATRVRSCLWAFRQAFRITPPSCQRVIDASSSLPMRLLITLGDSIEPHELVPAGNTAVVRSAPHLEILSETSLVVTHGGHGTVMAASCIEYRCLSFHMVAIRPTMPCGSPNAAQALRCRVRPQRRTSAPRSTAWSPSRNSGQQPERSATRLWRNCKQAAWLRTLKVWRAATASSPQRG